MTSSDTAVEMTGSSSQPSLFGQLAVLAVFVLLGTSVLVRSAGAVSPGSAVGLTVILAGVGVVLLWRRATSTADAGDHDSAQTQNTDATDTDTPPDESDSSVWNAIPSWQYEGRHVESGGLARSEQEKALQDIQQQAAELSEEPNEK
ncbi:uncharacterized protein Nmag_2037 [Natrialba magadii ATCC 43099]|uniref:Uncharacterized protein n=1 Tax=Natrialba magadii (strain ATCC 43099 / DSM 3394 / CCM 3739 / CIP 104546 / IAM 13178 / JCM 8861 / NBRC 102185 / NCIMB 2190 / MS3) TaxID=547559 RepID=D3SVJ9_NATMM|nr:DUF3995 domain-containing protein [Natrialba magadii]ADD05607.1 uncharacterized protein Nmag_2037 [Natrialba magadii ATCC 43099]ELY29980.1 hypothetical protein C500_10229 [Natrialba magadii ATCC 43099]